GWRRFPTGVFAVWYPIKQRASVRQFHADICQSGIRDIVAAELCLREPLDPRQLNGCGMVVVNPPYPFEQPVPPLLAALPARQGQASSPPQAQWLRNAGGQPSVPFRTEGAAASDGAPVQAGQPRTRGGGGDQADRR